MADWYGFLLKRLFLLDANNVLVYSDQTFFNLIVSYTVIDSLNYFILTIELVVSFWCHLLLSFCKFVEVATVFIGILQFSLTYYGALKVDLLFRYKILYDTATSLTATTKILSPSLDPRVAIQVSIIKK